MRPEEHAPTRSPKPWNIFYLNVQSEHKGNTLYRLKQYGFKMRFTPSLQTERKPLPVRQVWSPRPGMRMC